MFKVRCPNITTEIIGHCDFMLTPCFVDMGALLGFAIL